MINCLGLHRVTHGPTRNREDVHVDTFIALLRALPMPSVTIDAAWRTTDDAAVCLTFDDGYDSDFGVVAPLLSAGGMAATFFLVTDWVGRPGFVTWDQVRQMHEAGMQFGSHSVSHPDFRGLSSAQRATQAMASRKTIEDALGAPVSTFAFPYGYHDASIVDTILECGYTRCCTSLHGLARRGSPVVPRNAIHRRMGRRAVERTLAAGAGTRWRWRVEDAAKELLKRHLSRLYPAARAVILQTQK